ncbi:hypothetical protein Leryth_025875 [Lithospermum erythrorhizon]|nr:hypothetical protein Leryth_025875 [Lithospermum erythrorhizon]
MEKEYFKFMELLKVASENSRNKGSNDRKHPANIQVIGGKSHSTFSGMPNLVYVSREKDPTSPHHFKAGAINVMLRVSGMLSNAPYILVLDCDMYSNDPSSARQAMCFLLDNKITPTLAFVQFPQKFHNVSKNDIYDAGIRNSFEIMWPGLDGLGGPILSGTCFYIKRESLYVEEVDTDPILDKKSFGTSNEFLMSLSSNLNHRVPMKEDLNDRFLSEAKIVASCFYEEDTQWGKKIGFLYGSVVEDYFTGFTLHCKGWKSVYYNPSWPAFLGTATTNLSDTLVQGTRWMSGLHEVNLSRFSPLVYGLPRLPLLHCMGYAYVGSIPLYCILYSSMPSYHN